ncbi:hypothetical protein AJ79_04224 [Helicocarpus griseus UAMH5409]|uniref:BTB domain-containing protein n=1 Tax=Helicocarpus griseus UAMH5409 TaxID=1447875 RepID=A0A2B7XU15_9EURO|nr:hypothetical protein AJ79_04224 [Helicocarpus griseus UAMH5409]
MADLWLQNNDSTSTWNAGPAAAWGDSNSVQTTVKDTPKRDGDNHYPVDDLRISIARFVSHDGAEPLSLTATQLIRDPSLLHETKYTDLTIVAGSEIFKVHRCIVCPRSAFFAAACDGNFREASSGVVNLQEDPALVKKMIEFLYTLEYSIDTPEPGVPVEGTPVAKTIPSKGKISIKKPAAAQSTSKNISKHKARRNKGNKNKAASSRVNSGIKSIGHSSFSHNADSESVLLHTMMYALGERLMIDGLKSHAKEIFERELKSAEDPKMFTKAISGVYKYTPDHDRGLKDLVISIASKKLIMLEDLSNEFLQTVPLFSFDLLRVLVELRINADLDAQSR